MPIEVRWDNDEQTVIRHTYSEEWTTEDYIAVSKTTYDLIEEVNHTVHILIVVSDGVQPLSDMIAAARDNRAIRHDRQGLQVVVGATSFMILLTRVIRAVRPSARSVHFVNSIDDAYAIIHSASAINGKSR